jgi:hypothetical protein
LLKVDTTGDVVRTWRRPRFLKNSLRNYDFQSYYTALIGSRYSRDFELFYSTSIYNFRKLNVQKIPFERQRFNSACSFNLRFADQPAQISTEFTPALHGFQPLPSYYKSRVNFYKFYVRNGFGQFSSYFAQLNNEGLRHFKIFRKRKFSSKRFSKPFSIFQRQNSFAKFPYLIRSRFRFKFRHFRMFLPRYSRFKVRENFFSSTTVRLIETSSTDTSFYSNTNSLVSADKTLAYLYALNLRPTRLSEVSVYNYLFRIFPRPLYRSLHNRFSSPVYNAFSAYFRNSIFLRRKYILSKDLRSIKFKFFPSSVKNSTSQHKFRFQRFRKFFKSLPTTLFGSGSSLFVSKRFSRQLFPRIQFYHSMHFVLGDYERRQRRFYPVFKHNSLLVKGIRRKRFMKLVRCLMKGAERRRQRLSFFPWTTATERLAVRDRGGKLPSSAIRSYWDFVRTRRPGAVANYKVLLHYQLIRRLFAESERGRRAFIRRNKVLKSRSRSKLKPRKKSFKPSKKRFKFKPREVKLFPMRVAVRRHKYFRTIYRLKFRKNI